MLGSPQHPVFCGCHTVWANAMDLSEQCMMDGLSGTIPPTEIFMDPNLSQQDKVRGGLGGPQGTSSQRPRGTCHLFSVSCVQGTTYFIDSCVLDNNRLQMVR